MSSPIVQCGDRSHQQKGVLLRLQPPHASKQDRVFLEPFLMSPAEPILLAADVTVDGNTIRNNRLAFPAVEPLKANRDLLGDRHGQYPPAEREPMQRASEGIGFVLGQVMKSVQYDGDTTPKDHRQNVAENREVRMDDLGLKLAQEPVQTRVHSRVEPQSFAEIDRKSTR